MSPVSRGRKTRKSRSKRGAPTLDSVHAEMVRSFEQTVADDDPLQVEMFTSETVGLWWQAMTPDDDPEKVIGLSAVEYAVQRATPPAQAMLRAFAAVAGSPELREAAAAGAEALVERGVADPPWAASIGRVELGDCWQLRDVYGDQASVHCEFSYGAQRHILSVLIDRDPLTWVKDVWIADQVDEVVRELHEQAAEDAELTILEKIDPAAARGLIDEGIAQTDAIWQPGVEDTFRDFRAVALARCRAMPEPSGITLEVELTEQERADVVAEFLGSPEAKALPDEPVTRTCAGLIVDLFADYDLEQPLRISPAKVEMFVHEWLPDEELDEDVIETMPAVLVAWTRWAGVRSQLPTAALDQLVEMAEECAGHLTEAYEDVDAYLDDVETDDPDEVRSILERRIFAVPETSAQIGDEHYPDLDPADPDQRGLLIAAEHPEWQQLLEDPTFDGEVDGVNPRLHLAMHEMIANQLWDNTPPEAWLAAQRLLRGGADRHEVLHELMRVGSEQIHHALATRKPNDPAVYAKALDALGHSRVRRLR